MSLSRMLSPKTAVPIALAALAALVSPASATDSDQWQLSQDPTFQGRVQEALISTCVAIGTEGWAVAFHRERAGFCVSVLSAGTNQSQYVTEFANSVSTDSNVISDATQAGTVVLTTNNRAAQAALVTDTHIANAISGEINSFIREPGN